MAEFAQLQDDFYSRFPDLTFFDCQTDLNLTKTVLDALKVDYYGKGDRLERPMFRPTPQFLLREGVKSLRGRLKQIESGCRKVLVATDDRRLVCREGNPRSVYFDRIVDSFNRKDIFVASDNPSGMPDWVDYDLSAEQRYPLNAELLALRSDLLKTYQRFSDSKRFSEADLHNLRCSFQGFFDMYGRWSRVLQTVQPEAAIIICHYHKEGMVYAMRRHGVSVIELQHGLIDRSDIFYCFPENILQVRDRALFPDQILTFGEYWTDVLSHGHEFRANQIAEIGYYIQTDDSVAEGIKSFCEGKRTIMVATQTMMSEFYVPYVQSLLALYENDDDVRILVRPHPAEPRDAYNELATNPKVEVANEGGVDCLLPLVDCVVSVYSTVLFDAIRFGVPAFAIEHDACQDYVDSAIATGVVFRLGADEGPLNAARLTNPTKDAQYFYRSYNPETLRRSAFSDSPNGIEVCDQDVESHV
ncbi:sialyltransferase [Rhodopirellula europaea]|uniref:Sialyltransferase n=1 Tax=Rhodopirellula europaea SH398 TaxID=1263868 RepID=M5RZN0_9BACT|nr:sialyltransferase [Rhodopirellula europaea]EMI24765.1 sialyltransferase [Rhodopirellula europaea SH398]